MHLVEPNAVPAEPVPRLGAWITRIRLIDILTIVSEYANLEYILDAPTRTILFDPYELPSGVPR
jgi:hypothetical protein